MKAIHTERTLAAASSSPTVAKLAVLWARGTGIAVLAVAFAYTLAERTAGPLVVTGAGEVTLGNVIGFTIFGGTVGAALAYAVGRFARRPRMTFVAVTLIALAGYSVVPFTAAESVGTAIWLNILHLVVAIAVIGTLGRYLPRDRTSVAA